jgi:hypothetical protein
LFAATILHLIRKKSLTLPILGLVDFRKILFECTKHSVEDHKLKAVIVCDEDLVLLLRARECTVQAKRGDGASIALPNVLTPIVDDTLIKVEVLVDLSPVFAYHLPIELSFEIPLA